jgi:lipoprotein signal peptidase
MVQRNKLLLLAQLALALVALALLASGISQIRLMPGESINLLGLFSQNMDLTRGGNAGAEFSSDSEWFSTLRQIFWIVIPVVIIYAIISPSYRRRLIRTAITFTILIFAMSRLMDRIAIQEREVEEEGLGQMGLDAPGAVPAPPDYVNNAPEWTYWLVNIALALVIVTALLLVWRRFRPRPDPHTEVIREVERALASLEAGGNVDDIVMQCYVDMTEVLRRDQRMERRQAMTPREFEAQLAQAGFEDEHIRRLTRLFERVRYSTESSGRRDELEALSCLRAIAANYGATT